MGKIFGIYAAVLDDLASYKDERIPLKQFRSMLCSRHNCPKNVIKMVETDLVLLGAIKRNNKNVRVIWPFSTVFRRKGILTKNGFRKNFGNQYAKKFPFV